jgi:hypothetical protein
VACNRVKTDPAVDIACQAATGYLIDTVVDALSRAASRNACLEVRLGYPPNQQIWSPLGIAPYNGPHCHD